MRRPRLDSKLEALNDDRKRELCEWLLTPSLTLRVIRQMVAEEFRIETSLAALSRFYQAYCGAEVLLRRAGTVSLTEQVDEEIDRKPGQWDRVALDALKQKIFELVICRDAKPAELKQLFSLALKARDQDLNERRLRLAEAGVERNKKEISG